MIPSITAVRLSGARNRAELPLLVLGPSLGTSAKTLWTHCAAGLADAFDLVAWDLPGHGHNRVVPEEPFTMAELATGVLRVVDDVLAERSEPGGSFLYAGDSVGGAVGLQLLLDQPERVTSAVLLCTGAKIGDEPMWGGRIGQVSVSGTPVMVTGSAERWFGPGFLDREPGASARRYCTRSADRVARVTSRCVARWRASTSATGSPRSPRRSSRWRVRRRRHPAGEPASDRRRRQGGPLRRARGRGAPGAGRGAPGGRPRCCASTSSASSVTAPTTSPAGRSVRPG